MQLCGLRLLLKQLMPQLRAYAPLKIVFNAWYPTAALPVVKDTTAKHFCGYLLGIARTSAYNRSTD